MTGEDATAEVQSEAVGELVAKWEAGEHEEQSAPLDLKKASTSWGRIMAGSLVGCSILRFAGEWNHLFRWFLPD